MARFTAMHRFARWHIWLGWLAALPLLLWTISGLVMTLRPIDEVRGEDLRRGPGLLQTDTLIAPRLAVPVKRLTLIEENGAPVWIATDSQGNQSRYAQDGTPLPGVSEAEARQLSQAAFAGSAALVSMQRFSAEASPLDLRRPRPSWRATFDDGTHVYIDADTGEVLALRTEYWRFYDLMWGLHIMDPMGRENTSHALLWIFATVGIASSVLGTVLLFRRRKRKIGA
ncbi:MAG: hypothetical protein RL268_2744 [Pseudomonadota bacterium]|jgi:uncharacterized iron-regulated membrane protein